MMVNKMQTTYFFNKNILIFKELRKYAPLDSELLSIPSKINITDPFLKLILNSPHKEQGGNNFLKVCHLINFLQSINRVLSTVYAAHKYIKNSYNAKDAFEHKSQKEIDINIHIESEITSMYLYSIREFVSMLKNFVDQIILILPNKVTNKADCIGALLKSTDINFLESSRKFLIGLNCSANYLKHHRDQFESSSTLTDLSEPRLLITVSVSKGKKIFDTFKEHFSVELLNKNNTSQEAKVLISCKYLVKEFNILYGNIIRTCTSSVESPRL